MFLLGQLFVGFAHQEECVRFGHKSYARLVGVWTCIGLVCVKAHKAVEACSSSLKRTYTHSQPKQNNHAESKKSCSRKELAREIMIHR